MVYTTGSTSLRRLVPRIFSRAQPADGFDKLLKTVRQHHPKADLIQLEQAHERLQGRRMMVKSVVQVSLTSLTPLL